MNIPRQEYEKQIERAKEAIRILEERIRNVRSKLDIKPEDAVCRRELKQLNLDMKITMNEIEHAQNELDNSFEDRPIRTRRPLV